MNSVSFGKGETTGSMALRNLNIQRYETAPVQTSEEGDKVCFKGINNHKEKTGSVIGCFAATFATAALVVAGLGYAHKTNAVSKLKDGKIKDFLKNSDKITKPCYDLCTKIKGFCTEYYNKIKDFFTKKK